MKRIKTYSSILAAGILMMLAVGCVKEKIDDDEVVHLKAGVYHPALKGSSTDDSGIMDSDYDEAFDINLVRIDENDGDYLYYPVFKSCSSVLTAHVSKPDDTYMRDVQFTTAQYYRNNNDHIRYASWYPTTGAYTGGETCSVKFNVDGKTDILYGTVASGSKTDSFSSIQFNHALCQFNIYAYKMVADGDVEGVEYDWGALEDVTVNSLQKYCTLTLPDDSDNSEKYTIAYSDSELQNISLSTTTGIRWNTLSEIPEGFGSKALVSTFLAPPPSSTKGYLNLKVSTATKARTGESAYQEVSIARNFQPGCAYDIVLRFSSHGFINAEVSIGKWNYVSLGGDDKFVQDVAADMYYDLSAYHTANCYIVPAGNYGYSFAGNRKGNSKTADLDPGYIDILWADNADLLDYVQLASHTLSENRVMFKVGDTKGDDKTLAHKGNVVIAAYKDSSKEEILWTWHLWLTDSAQNIGYTNGYQALNMNLGATEEGGAGLYYQWGRKDPFTSAPTTLSTETASIEETIANPTTFYGKGGTTWFSGTEDDMKGLWGWKSDNDDIAETIYDPCPSGYHVADYRLWGDDHISTYQKSADAYVVNSKVTIEIENTAVVFPLTQGYLDENGSKTTSNHPLFMWSSSLDPDGNNPYALYYDSSKSSLYGEESHRNYGGAVRCLSKSASVVHDLSAVQTSNCYIVSSDGYYKFKATVAGNGVDVLVTNTSEQWDITGSGWGNKVGINKTLSPTKVEYLWYQPALDDTETSETTLNEDGPGVTIVNTLPDSNGYITFAVSNFKKGNLILAAYNGDEIIWTWHIWLVDKPENIKSGTYTLMDRNVGATSADPSTSPLTTYGFYYQFGRKDPFPGPASVSGSSSGTNSSTWYKYVDGTWVAKGELDAVLSGAQYIANVVKTPTSFITNSTPSLSGDNSTCHWMNAPLGGSSPTKALWGYSVVGTALGYAPGKTMYDPCPVGYKAMWHDALTITSVSGISNYCASVSGADGVYPLAGYRSYSTGCFTNAGTDGYIFTAIPTNSGYSGRAAYFNSSWSYREAGQDSVHYCPANGYSMRCQKE